MKLVVLLMLIAQAASAEEPTVTVFTVSVDLPAGAQITTEHLVEKQMPKRLVGPGYVTANTLSYVLNQPISAPLLAGDPLLWSSVATRARAIVIGCAKKFGVSGANAQVAASRAAVTGNR